MRAAPPRGRRSGRSRPSADARSHRRGRRRYIHSPRRGSIGKRYRRQDEIGTPLCITIDFETVGDDKTAADGCVTVRDRDTMQQERVKIEDLRAYIEKKIEF